MDFAFCAWLIYSDPMAAEQASDLFTTALRKVKTALRMPPRILLFAAAFWLLTWPAKLATRLVPADRLVRAMGRDAGLDPAPPPLDERQAGRARDMADAFALATRYSVLRGPCLAQALVARMALSMARMPHAVCLGVNRPEASTQIEAHAWVIAGGMVICGGESSDKYTLVRSFKST